MTAAITGTGSALPERVVTNGELEKILDTSDTWIRERTGIRQRRVVTEESVTGLALLAARRALEDAGRKPEEIDLIIAATATGDNLFPSLACEVQGQLGAAGAMAFDLNAACSGFLFALNTARAYICSGFAKRVLVIGAEAMSRAADWTDRASCILFGEGAGAVCVEASEEGGILVAVNGAKGEQGSVLTCVHRTTSHPFMESVPSVQTGMIQMDGRAVYQFAVSTVPEVIQELMRQDETGGVDHYILHQANERIIRSIAKRLKEPLEKFPMNVQEVGNLSAASVPVLLDEANRKGILKKGERLVLAGFGAGLTYGAALIEWKK